MRTGIGKVVLGIPLTIVICGARRLGGVLRMSKAWKDFERRCCKALGGDRILGNRGSGVPDSDENVPFALEAKHGYERYQLREAWIDQARATPGPLRSRGCSSRRPSTLAARSQLSISGRSAKSARRPA
jgi:hypothetical protein